jgi:DNA-binding SARP family transcriptional activator/tetratricopeptide (TPR) repeat protein
MGSRVEFGVLGPLQVLIDGAPVPVRAGRQRALLVTLLVHAGAGVSVDQLAEHLWGANPPTRARGTLQTYVMRLRHLLGPAAPIRTVPDGYLIDVDEKTIDLARFEPLIEQGEEDRAAGNLPAASAAFTAALGLWRGPAMVDVPSENLQRDIVPRLNERRLHAMERRVEVDLQLGRHAALVGELTALTCEHPLRERFWAQLMVALYRSGRQADALAAYRKVENLLGEQLGIDPGEELRRVHGQVLSGDVALEATATASAPVVRPDRVVPSQLPADIGDFVGRDRAVSLIQALLRTAQGVPVVTLAGPPGVGKTALAVHTAHRMRADFPDGQLYVNLHGYAPGPPRSAVDVLPRFLRALGVEPESVPLDQDEQETMFRSRLTGKRLLLVLDNAATAEQIRPLLPGSSGCAVLVTSRDTLRGLAVSHAASNIRLDVLELHETRALLAGMLGEELVTHEQQAADELAELCAHLPLALRIAAANLISRPEMTLAEYVDELRDGNRLAALTVEGDERAAVHAAFDLSYKALPLELAQMFRLLSLAPGTYITPDVAAALSGLTTQDARRRLDRLATANLIGNHAPNRYQFHDLLREYAAERLAFETEPGKSREGFRRLVDWSVRSADNASDAMKNSLLRLPRTGALPGVTPRTFSSNIEAKTWLDAERANLVALVVHAAEHHPDSRPWQLADALRGYFYTQGLPAEWLAMAKAGLSGARAALDPVGEGAMLSSLGTLYWALGQHRVALDHYQRALPPLQRGDIPEAEAAVLSNIGGVYIDLGELVQAADHLESALVITQRIGAHQREAIALFNLGGVYLQLGQIDRAARSFEGSLAVSTRLGAWMTIANNVRALGEVLILQGEPAQALQMFERAGSLYERAAVRNFAHTPHEGSAAAYVLLGRYDEAITEITTAMAMATDIGNVKGVCDANNVLGEALCRAGRPEEGVAHHREALHIAEETGYRWGICTALLGLAGSHLLDGRFEEALDLAGRALDGAKRYRLRLAEVDALVVLGRVHLALGDHARALGCARRALGMTERSGQRLVHARASWLAGDALLAAGDSVGARPHWRRACEVFDEVGSPYAEHVRATAEGVVSG